jgi:hypothetical protein
MARLKAIFDDIHNTEIEKTRYFANKINEALVLTEGLDDSFTLEDIEKYVKWMNDFSTTDGLGSSSKVTTFESERAWLINNMDKKEQQFAIVLKETDKLGISVNTDFERYINQRLAQLEESLNTVNMLAESNELPDAIITNNGLKITPFDAIFPENAQSLVQNTATLLPHVKITELLIDKKISRQ